jgi:glucuronate isomerase
MNATAIASELEEALGAVPLLDAHTHLVAGKLAAQGLHDVMLYHMVISDLYAAGCPNGARLTAFPSWPSQEEAHARIEEALPYVPRIQNTSMAWCLRIILADLYDWHEPITAGNWRRLDALIRERANDRTWPHSILDRLHIERTVTEIVRREGGVDDQRLQYALEWGFFTRCQWGEYDTPLYELERCWGHSPESPTPIGGTRPPTDRTIRTLDDVRTAMAHYVANIPYDQILVTAIHLSTDIDYRLVSDAEMEAALKRRPQAGLFERDTYASFINEALLSALEPYADRIVLQFSFGAEPAPFETVSRLSQRTIAQLVEIVGRHPRIRFQCLLASRHAHQSLCSMARELPNLSLAGYWWHTFFPSIVRGMIAERLDMLPACKQIGFFSDAYSVEWCYGKAIMVRKQLAAVLAEQIAQGRHDRESALEVARAVLYESPQTLLGMTPRSQ